MMYVYICNLIFFFNKQNQQISKMRHKRKRFPEPDEIYQCILQECERCDEAYRLICEELGKSETEKNYELKKRRSEIILQRLEREYKLKLECIELEFTEYLQHEITILEDLIENEIKKEKNF